MAHGKQFAAEVAKTFLFRVEEVVPLGPKDVQAAASVCMELAKHDLSSTIGYFHAHEVNAEKIVQDHVQASNLLRNICNNRFYLSVKPWQLNFDIDYVTRVAETAILNSHGIHFDSLSDDVSERSFDLLEGVMDRSTPRINADNTWHYSVTLPARWRRSVEDAERAVRRGMRVRVVKGELRAGNQAGEASLKGGFLALVDRLAGRVPEIAIATHDYAVAKAALALSLNRGSSIQLELLHDFPKSNMLELAREMKVPIRIYVPYGSSLLYFAVKSFVKDPRKMARFVKERLHKNRRPYSAAWRDTTGFLDCLRTPI